MCFSLSWRWDLCFWQGSSAGARGASVGSQLKIGCRLWWASHRQRPGLPPKCHLCKHHQRLPHPIQTKPVQVFCCPSEQSLPPASASLPCPRAVSQDSMGTLWVLSLDQTAGYGAWAPSEIGAASNALPEWVPAVAGLSPQSWQPSAPYGAVVWNEWGWGVCLSQAGAYARAVIGSRAAAEAVLSPLSTPLPWASRCASHKHSLGLPQPSC